MLPYVVSETSKYFKICFRPRLHPGPYWRSSQRSL